MRFIVDITSLLSVSKLKPTSPYYLPYLNAFPGVVPPAKKATKKAPKKAPKQALKPTPATLAPSAAPPASSTCSISNTCAYLYTASVTPEASAANKYRKPSAPPPGLPKPGQRAKPMKVTRITYIEPPIDRSQHVRFQDKNIMEVEEVEEAISYQVLEGCGRRRYYNNETKEEVKARKEYRRDKFHAKWKHNIKTLKGLNLKVPLDLKRLN
jgi:hypothetical protein